MKENEIKMTCDAISSVFEFLIGEWTEEQMFENFKRIELPKEVIEHVHGLILATNNEEDDLVI